MKNRENIFKELIDVLHGIDSEIKEATSEKELRNILNKTFQSLDISLGFHKGYVASWDEETKLIKLLCLFGQWDKKARANFMEYFGKSRERSSERGKLMQDMLALKSPYKSLIISDFKEKYLPNIGINQAIATPIIWGGKFFGGVVVSYNQKLFENSRFTQVIREVQEFQINYIVAPVLLFQAREIQKKTGLREIQLRSIHYFVNSRAHDMKGYFNRIHICTQRIMRKKDLILNTNPDLKDLIEKIKSYSKKGLIGFKEIISAVKKEGKSEEIEIGFLLNEILNSIPNDLFYNIKLETLFTDKMYVFGWKDQLRIAFHNIIMNALEAMTKGGTLFISQKYIKDGGGKVAVSIKDTGCGMSKRRVEQITKAKSIKSTKKEGLGLGMQISKYYINLNDGELEIKSTINEGTEVKILFEVAKRI